MINIKNNDNKCFLWCHVRHLILKDRHNDRIDKNDKILASTLNYSDIKFDVVSKDYCRIEKQNNICINLFSYENGVVYLIYISSERFRDTMDLLLILQENKSRYVYIKDFDRFMFNKSKNKNIKYFCRYCLPFFTREDVLIEHKKNSDNKWKTKCKTK